jgi:hypothetical protein
LLEFTRRRVDVVMRGLLLARFAAWERDLLAGVPTARIVELPGANLYMFLSNEADVRREVRAFAGAVSR